MRSLVKKKERRNALETQLNTLQDLNILIDKDEIKDKAREKNPTEICIAVTYLIGVPWERCANMYPGKYDEYAEIKNKHPDCHLIHALCKLRTILMRNESEINRKLKYELKSLRTINETAGVLSEINELSEDIPFTNKTVIDDIAVIEKVLNRKIDDVLTILPSWVEKKFIKKLFLINTAFASELKKFRRNRNLYPYSAYINWEPKPAGNILLNDRRFLSIIYRENGAQFHDIEKINKVNVHTVMSVYEYIEQTNGNIRIIIDCENTDPYKFMSVLSMLDKKEYGKIDSIMLYNDAEHTRIWDCISEQTDIPVEIDNIKRVVPNKSLVDIRMTYGITKAYYKDNISSFIIVSSDSDFWGVISAIPDADFLIVVDDTKTGQKIKEVFTDASIKYCDMNDFDNNLSKKFKRNLIKAEFETIANETLTENIDTIIDKIDKTLFLRLNENERAHLRNDIVNSIRASVTKNGTIKISVLHR